MLRHVAHGRPGNQGVGAENADRASSWLEQSEGEFDQGGLAPAIGSNHSHELPCPDSQVDIEEHFPVVIGERHAIEFDDRLSGRGGEPEFGLWERAESMAGAGRAKMVGRHGFP